MSAPSAAMAPDSTGTGLRAQLNAVWDRDALALLWRYIQPYRWALVVFSTGAVLQSLLVLPVLWMVRRTFDIAIPGHDVRSLVFLGAGIVAIRAVGSVLALALRHRMLGIVKGAVTAMRVDIVTALLHQARARHDQMDVAQTHTQVVQETERVDRVANVLLSGLLPALITSGGVILVLMILDARLLAMGLGILPVIWLSSRWLSRRVQGEVRQFQRAFERFSRSVNFALRQLDLIRLTGAEADELTRQRRGLHELQQTGERMAMSYAVHGQLQRTLVGVAGIVILVAGGISVASGTLSMGSLLTFYVASGVLNGHLDSILGAIPEVIAGNVSLRTLASLLRQAEPEPYTGTAPVGAAAVVSLQGVHFRYGDRPVLSGVDLTISPGDNIMIAGENGAGKSTLVWLIAGLYRPHAGRVCWDDADYASLSMPALRRQLGVVPQHASFFLGTVRDNLTFGRGAITDEVLADALFRASADAVIARLPRGLDSSMGEVGQLLSGGERQRLAIARALLGSPRLLVLDEPTTHLDVDTIGEVMTRLLSWDARPSVLTITHDPAVLAYAGSVYRLEAGRLLPVAAPAWPTAALAY